MPIGRSARLPMPMTAERGPLMPEAGITMRRAMVHRPISAADEEDEDYDEDSSEQAPVHRTFFPETWLWRLERMRSVAYKTVL